MNREPGHRRSFGRGRRSLLATCAGGFVLISSGCALIPKFGPPPQVGPPYIPPPEPVWVVLDPALYQATDTTRSAAGDRLSTRRSRSTAMGPSQRLPEPTGRDTTATWIDRRAPISGVPAESVQAPAPALSIDLPTADRLQLSDAAHRNLSAADSLARGFDRRPLSPRDRAKLENALGLVRQAEEALGRGDLRAAANLAYKARLLAAEVAR